jgi:predicted DNA binding CopG/RHH family protein
MKRNHDMRIRLSQEELEKIKGKAQALGISISDFVRLLCLSANVPTKILRDI